MSSLIVALLALTVPTDSVPPAPPRTLPELEDRNLLDLARITAHAALVREESRGAHDRSDAPEAREAWRHSLVWTLQPAIAAEEVPA